jgi:1-acyl-sn-glycerol-3-phosphate acyltransferase
MAILKSTAVFFFILTYMVAAAFIWGLPFLNPWTKRKLCTRMQSRYCRLGLFLLGVRVKVLASRLLPQAACLTVGNHVSYLDILILSSVRPTCFVTSNEIKETPLLGWLCRLAGCLFVERRNRGNLPGEVAEITEALKQGLNVVVFPEATSTNGESLLRFRRPLFAAAPASGASLLPFCLNYRRLNGTPVSLHNRDFLFWYGEMSFAPHLWALARQRQVDVDLVFMPSFKARPDEALEDLASRSRAEVEAVFQPIQSHGGFRAHA